MNLRHRSLRVCGTMLAAALPWVLPAIALAAQEQDERGLYEGRLDGFYPLNVRLLPDPGSTGLTWMLLIALGTLAIVVLFKDAKRSHLD